MRKLEYPFILLAILIVLYAWLDGIEYERTINIQHVHLDSVQKIIPIKDSLIVPVLYDSLLISQTISTVDETKERFINQVLPAIIIVKYQLDNQSKKAKRLIHKISIDKPLHKKETIYIDSLMKQFRAKTYDNLILRMKPHPVSIVLAQAALESGWGSSRFAIEGNNLFGIWGSPKDKNIIKSLYNREENHIYVKKYLNVAESIDHYYLTLGRNNAYKQFRQMRSKEVDVYQLIATLDRYSERGEEYTKDLKKIIEWNKLEKYDSYTIDPNYIITTTVWDHYYHEIAKTIKTAFENKFSKK